MDESRPLPGRILLDGQQVAGLFRHYTCNGAQAEGEAITWYFDAGLNVRFVGGQFTLGIAPTRCDGPFADRLDLLETMED